MYLKIAFALAVCAVGAFALEYIMGVNLGIRASLVELVRWFNGMAHYYFG